MARFCGIKQLEKKLPKLVLFIIYQYYVLNYIATLKKLKKFKTLGAYYVQHPILEYGNRRCIRGNSNIDITFKDVSLEQPNITAFKLVYDKTPPPNTPSAKSGLLDLWIVLTYDSIANIVSIYYSDLYDNYPPRFKKGWMSILSCSVSLLDKVFRDVNPQTINFNVYKCTGESPSNISPKFKASLRLVDAVRTAAKNKIIDYQLVCV